MPVDAAVGAGADSITAEVEAAAGAGVGALAVCGGAVGAGSIAAGIVTGGGGATGVATGVGALRGAGVGAVAFAGLAFGVSATFFGGCDLAGAGACALVSIGALGVDASLPASANTVGELLPFVLVSATLASDFTGAVLTLDSGVVLPMILSITNAPPRTMAVMNANAKPK